MLWLPKPIVVHKLVINLSIQSSSASTYVRAVQSLDDEDHEDVQARLTKSYRERSY